MISRLGGSPWLRAGAIVLLLLAVTLPLTAFAGQERSEVCHLDDDGNYLLITVADPAIDAHIAHGDSEPGTNGLDENCAPLADADGDGVSDADDNCVNTPNPDQSNRYGSSKGDACEDDSNGDGDLDVNESDICVSINGQEIIKAGLALCYSDDAGAGNLPNIAVTHGFFATAYANGYENNTATAEGVYAYASTAGGSHNIAASKGNYNGTVTQALIQDGDFNIATATGDGAYASAVWGSNNEVTATGTNPQAFSSFGDNNTVNAIGAGAYAIAQLGSDNVVTADGVDAWAESTNGSNNTVTATGTCTVIVNGYSGVTDSCP